MFKYLFLLYVAVLIAAIFEPLLAFLAVLIFMLPIVLLAPKSGRWWCGNACPRGSLQDLFSKVVQRPVPPWLQAPALRYAIMLLMFSRFLEILHANWGNWSMMGASIANLMWVSTIIGLLLMITAPARAWCNICPMGTVGKHLAPKNKATLMVSAACVSCKLCKKRCPVGLKPYKAKGNPQGFINADCIQCGKCAAVCPQKAITLLK